MAKPAHEPLGHVPLAKSGRRPSINEASRSQLERVCRLDRQRAERLVDYRRAVGRISCWYQLEEVPGFDDALIDALKRRARI